MIFRGNHIFPRKLKKKNHLWDVDGYPSKQLITLIRQIVFGLKYLHENKILHRDLNPTNVLIQIVNEDMVPKLSDMGISTLLKDKPSDCRTFGWKASYLLFNDQFIISTDMLNLGCLIFFCITKGKHPFGDVSVREENIRKGDAHTLAIGKMHEAHDLINKLLNQIPGERLNVKETLRYPFFWKSGTKMAFIAQVSDAVKSEGRNGIFESLVEKVAPKVFGMDWSSRIDLAILAHFQKLWKIFLFKIEFIAEVDEELQVSLH